MELGKVIYYKIYSKIKIWKKIRGFHYQLFDFRLVFTVLEKENPNLCFEPFRTLNSNIDGFGAPSFADHLIFSTFTPQLKNTTEWDE